MFFCCFIIRSNRNLITQRRGKKNTKSSWTDDTDSVIIVSGRPLKSLTGRIIACSLNFNRRDGAFVHSTLVDFFPLSRRIYPPLDIITAAAAAAAASRFGLITRTAIDMRVKNFTNTRKTIVKMTRRHFSRIGIIGTVPFFLFFFPFKRAHPISNAV